VVDLTSGVTDDSSPVKHCTRRTAPQFTSTGSSEADFETFVSEMMQSKNSRKNFNAEGAQSVAKSASTESLHSEPRSILHRPRRGIIAPGDDLPYFGSNNLQGAAEGHSGPADGPAKDTAAASSANPVHTGSAPKENGRKRQTDAHSVAHAPSAAPGGFRSPPYSPIQERSSTIHSAPTEKAPVAAAPSAPIPSLNPTSTQRHSSPVAASVPSSSPLSFEPLTSAHSAPDSPPSPTEGAAPMCKSPPAVIIIDMSGEATVETTLPSAAPRAAPTRPAQSNAIPSNTSEAKSRAQRPFSVLPVPSTSGTKSSIFQADETETSLPSQHLWGDLPTTSTSGNKRSRATSAATKEAAAEPEVITLDSDSEDTDPDIKPPSNPPSKRAKRSRPPTSRSKDPPMHEHAEATYRNGVYEAVDPLGGRGRGRRSIPVVIPPREEQQRFHPHPYPQPQQHPYPHPQQQQQQQVPHPQQQYYGFRGGSNAFGRGDEGAWKPGPPPPTHTRTHAPNLQDFVIPKKRYPAYPFPSFGFPGGAFSFPPMYAQPQAYVRMPMPLI
jgi:hypothetical protein